VAPREHALRRESLAPPEGSVLDCAAPAYKNLHEPRSALMNDWTIRRIFDTSRGSF
jgi:hypothetical protein